MKPNNLVTIFLLIGTALISHVASQESITVNAGDLGPIKGFKFYTNKITRSYYAFGGIPYGVTPTGNNRFKAAEVRTGPLNGGSDYIADRWDSICPQKGLLERDASKLSGDEAQLHALLNHPDSMLNRSMFGIPEFTGNDNNTSPRAMGFEDCLHLHINTPRIPNDPTNPDELMPVIVYVHGGSFMSFWSSLFNGGRFLNHDVLLIPINYRLGVLGFYNLGIDDAPGNAGLYDLVTSLQWIQRYIHFFGGDPRRVTITGQSAGAAAVTNLMASPLGAGLFQNVIGCSGTATQEWAITTGSNALKESLVISEKVGCYDPVAMPQPLTAEEKQTILECMRRVSDATLVNTLTAYRYEDRKNKGLGFHAGCPSVQDSPHFTDATVKVVPEDPFTVMEEGRHLPGINLMVGTTRHDGSFVLQEAYDDFIVPNDLQNNASYIRSQLLSDILTILGMEDKTYGVVQSLADVFMGESKYADELGPLFPGLIDMFSVFFYKALAYRTAEFNSAKESGGKSYLFSFDHKGPWSLHTLTNLGGPIKGGVSHTDDQIYLFQWFPFFNVRDQNVATRWVNNWVNFATYGNPNGPDSGNPELERWPPYPRYMQIGKYSNTGTGDTAREFYRDEWKWISYDIYPLPTTTTTTAATTTTTTAASTTTTTTTTTEDPNKPPNMAATLTMSSITMLLICCVGAAILVS